MAMSSVFYDLCCEAVSLLVSYCQDKIYKLVSIVLKNPGENLKEFLHYVKVNVTIYSTCCRLVTRERLQSLNEVNPP